MLDNGELANIAVYSHKAGQNKNVREIAGKKRTGWVVLGSKDGAEHGATAKKVGTYVGVLTDTWFDQKEASAKVVAPWTGATIFTHSHKILGKEGGMFRHRETKFRRTRRSAKHYKTREYLSTSPTTT
jgi:hypothetical protein